MFSNLTPVVGLGMARSTNVAQLRERLTNVELDELPVGTQIMISTGDRKHPFLATVRSKQAGNIMLKTKTSSIEIVMRKDGSVSHVSRWPIRSGAFPQETTLKWWKLAE
jgi:hypothetical protein